MRKQEKKNEELKYIINRIVLECQNKSYYTLGVSTSMKNNLLMEEFVNYCEKKFEGKNIDIKIKKLQPISHYADALEEARSCDAIILVERYMYTTYRGMEKVVELLNYVEIPLLGVVNVRW